MEYIKEALSAQSEEIRELASEAKLHSSIHSTFEALVVQCALGYCREEELDPFC